MCLGFSTKQIHFVLIQTLVRAELKLLITGTEIHVIDRVTNMATPGTDFVFLEQDGDILDELARISFEIWVSCCGHVD